MSLATTFTLELRGLAMGGLDTDYPFANKPLEGFGSLSYRGEPRDRAGAHGQLPPRQLLSGRLLRWAVNVLGDDGDEVEELLAALASALAPVTPEEGTLDLLIRLVGGRTYLARGVVTRTAGDDSYLPQLTPLRDVEFTATDPRFYSAEEHQAEAPAPETSGGLGFPHGFPHAFGTATSGALALANEGNFWTPPVVTIEAGAGGLTNPTYTLGETGEVMRIAIALAEGESLTIDHDARTVLLGGTASRSTAVDRSVSSWFELPPGDSTLDFTASGEGTLTVAWRDAWLL